MEEINKYLIIENVPYEGKNTWTVFASDVAEANKFVQEYESSRNRYVHITDWNILKYNVKTKQKGIHKTSGY
jgi:hypothetical protein